MMKKLPVPRQVSESESADDELRPLGQDDGECLIERVSIT